MKNRSTVCPSCGCHLGRPPQRQVRCPRCRATIILRVVLVTLAQAEAMDVEEADRERRARVRWNGGAEGVGCSSHLAPSVLCAAGSHWSTRSCGGWSWGESSGAQG
ncbi:MAG TPA: hypothetical protein VGO93_16770 [Candidatus Xenobia bacterium]